MSYKDPTYVIFDGDEDKWAYSFMKGWKANDRIDFDFRDAHDLDTMTSRAQDEDYVKSKLRPRMKQSSTALVLIGEKTKNLYRFVRWELDLALELGVPIIAANLNEKRALDSTLCPPIIRDECVMHVAFKMKIIKHALDNWPAQYYGLVGQGKASGPYHYPDKTYADLGL